MKFHLMSDLHLEHRAASERQAFSKRLDQQLKAEPVDTVVLAGDIGSIYYMDDLVAILKDFANKYKNVIYVPGNHEFFHGRIVEDGQRLAEALFAERAAGGMKGTIHYLRPGDRVTVEGKVFAGGTGWYPDCGDKYMKRQWIDYDRVDDCDPEAHGQNQNFVEKNLQPGVDVMVSHMLPTEECVGGRWIGKWTNIFFVMGIEEALAKAPKENLPKAWLFGHTHDPKNFLSKYGFKAYCNPMGYPFEGANPGFWDQLVVEV